MFSTEKMRQYFLFWNKSFYIKRNNKTRKINKKNLIVVKVQLHLRTAAAPGESKVLETETYLVWKIESLLLYVTISYTTFLVYYFSY